MPRWLIITLISVASIAAIVLLLLIMSGTQPEDVSQLVAEGAIKELRDELRPPRLDAARVLILALDGVGDREMRQAIGEGRVPNLSRLVGAADLQSDVWESAYSPRGALSILPSTTYAAWTAVFTGEPVAIAGVSGNEWFDRATRQFVAPAPVSVSGYGDAVRVYTDGLLDDWIAVPTLFERANVRSYASLVAQHRGADLLIQPDASMLGNLVARVSEGIGGDDETDPDTYSALDRQSVTKTLEAIDEYGLADLLVVYFPGIDLYTHVAEPALPEQLDYLADVLDPLIGELLEAYDERGALDDTYVIVVSDHGHTPSVEDDFNALGTGEGDEWPGVLEAAGFRLRPFEPETDDSTYQAAFAYQGAFAYLYLADRSSCPEVDSVCDWIRPPRFDEDVLTAVRAIDDVNRGRGEVPDLRGTIDLILAREARGIEPAEAFSVWDGSRLVSVGDYLSTNPRPDLLDLEERLEHLSAGPLGHFVGDVLLLSRYRFEDPIEDRFYFSRKYRSWHGSPSAQDSEITWILARRGMSGETLRDIARQAIGDKPGQLDITPLTLHLLGAP